jgi:hypothetical protein
MVHILAELPPNVHLVQRKSAWNNTETMVSIIRLIGRTLRSIAPYAHVVLSMDAARIHLNAVVFQECFRWHLRVVVIPALLTAVLQPLDTHAFAALKRALRDAYQRALGANGGRTLSPREWVNLVAHCSWNFFRGRPWAASFENNGFGSQQQRLSRRVLDGLELASPPEVGSERPSAAVIARLFPRGSRFDRDLVTMHRVPFILRFRATAASRAGRAAMLG